VILLSLFYKEIPVRFESGKNGGARTWRNHFAFIFASDNLKEFHTAGTEVGATVYGIGNDPILTGDEKSGIQEIGVVSSMGKVEKVIITEI
jgi:hypothetical protein